MTNDRGYFVHERALVETEDIGEETRIWAFAHVLKGARIGRDCNIGDHCFIEDDVVIGDHVVIKNGVSIWNRVRIEDGAFVGPNVAFINDLFPRSKLYREEYYPTLVKQGASIGANATLLGGITIGRYALIGAGAVVTRDVPDHALVFGNPARVRGYVCECSAKIALTNGYAACECGRRYIYEAETGGLRLEGTGPRT